MRSRSRWLRAFARSQRGTSYALPYVLVVPFYLAFVLAVFEMGFLLIAKIGTQTAAHAAARSAAVWHSAPAEKLPELRPKQAAWMALAAYAGGRQRELDAAGPVPPEARESARSYADAVRRYTDGGHGAGAAPPVDFFERKFLNAAARTTVTVAALAPGDPHGPLRVTVTYRAPLYVPVVSRFLDADGRAPFERPVTVVVVVPNEAPETVSGTIGIDTDPTRLPPGGAR